MSLPFRQTYGSNCVRQTYSSMCLRASQFEIVGIREALADSHFCFHFAQDLFEKAATAKFRKQLFSVFFYSCLRYVESHSRLSLRAGLSDETLCPQTALTFRDQ